MLVIFAFSITPQKSIHDIVAKHTDPTKCNVHKDIPFAQVEKSSIHCSYDNFVATSPFVEFSFTLHIAPLKGSTIFDTAIIPFLYSYTQFSFESRGPPSSIV